MSAPEKKPHFALVVFCFVMCLGSAAAEFHTVRIFLHAQRVAGWPTAQGTITRSEFEEKFQGRRLYVAHVGYDFSVEGKPYSSTSVRTRGNSNEDASDIRALVDKFPVGSMVKVYYKPTDPTESYLEAGVDFVNYIIIISPVVFCGMFGAACFELVRVRRKFDQQSSIDDDEEDLDDLESV